MDAKFYFDTYKFTLGAGTTGIHMTLTWATGDDACDIFLWDEANAQGTVATTTVDRENGGFVSLTPLAPYYVGVYFYQNNSGAPYQLELVGQ